VQLNDIPDAIKWLPYANGQYSAKSAYEIQFFGSDLATTSGKSLECERGRQDQMVIIA
jgi:hypothetical protein